MHMHQAKSRTRHSSTILQKTSKYHNISIEILCVCKLRGVGSHPLGSKWLNFRFFSIMLHLLYSNHQKAKNAQKSNFRCLRWHFSKWRPFSKFRFFPHNSGSLVLTPKKSSATDSACREDHFGGICNALPPIFWLVEPKNRNFDASRHRAIPKTLFSLT